MIINFRQGIVKYPTNGNAQQFLVRNGSNVSLNVFDYRRVDISFASGDQNYLYSEINAVPAAWINVPNSVDVWLYWDLNVKTGLRTFGFTLVQPTYGAIKPTSPAEDQHWFDTVSHNMYVYAATTGWIRKIRVFAAKINTNTFTPLGADAQLPYAGTQVGIFGQPVDTSYITYDVNSNPIVRSNGEFFTLNTELFARGSSVNQVKLEANVVQLIAAEPIARYSVVKLVDFDHIGVADYSDLTSSVCGIAMDDLEPDELGRVVMQGVISNQTWNWSTPGAYLWALNGNLVTTDAHVQDVLTYTKGEPPIARVLSPTSILVTQINKSPTESLGRTITGTANQIVVVNGDGVAGNPIISIAESANLTGIPTAPTAPLGTNTAQLATTAFVLANAVAPVTSVAGKVGAVTLVVGDVSGAAPLASPALTGIPTSPTAAPGTSTTQIASTAFVSNAISSIVQGVEVLSEGVQVVNPATSLNFTGTGVLTTNVGGAVTVDITGGGGGSLTLQDDTTTDATYYPMFATATAGALTTAKVSSYKLQFMPISGKLYATEFNSSSDATLKHNILRLTNSIDVVNQLNGVSFNWNDTGIKSYGVIAQEVETILPELVSTVNGVKSVNYQALSAFLIECIKDLSARVDALESK